MNRKNNSLIKRKVVGGTKKFTFTKKLHFFYLKNPFLSEKCYGFL